MTALTDALEDVPWLLEQLAVTELRLDRVSRGLRSGARPEQPVPFNPDAAELHRALANTLTTWVRHLCEQRGMQYTPVEYVSVGYLPASFIGPLRRGQHRMPPGYAEPPATAAARWLHAHALTVRLDEAAGQIYGDIMRGVEAGMRAINPPTEAIFRGPCPASIGAGPNGQPIECLTPLYADGGADFIVCPRCDACHNADKLEARLLTRIGGTLFTVPELVRVLRELGEPVPRGTIASWVGRDQLRARAWRDGERVVTTPPDHHAKPMYRIDEVRKLRNVTQQSRGSTA